MFRPFSTLLGTTIFTIAALILELSAAPMAHGHGGHGGHGGGGWHGGAYHGGIYHGHYGGFHPYGYGGFYRPYYGYGFYRPYYGYGLGYGLAGFGLGYGLGSALGGYGLGSYGVYVPYYGGYGIVPSAIMVNAPSVYPNAGAAPANNPPPDNAAHLQLVVPENAEVLFGGEKTRQTGAVREFVSPPLPPGEVFTYKITVRYPNANGKTVEDKRPIRVRANDWFRIDFTRPAPPEQPPEPPQPRPGAV